MKASKLIFDVINKEESPDYLNQIGRPEADRLLYMLQELAITREDLANFTPAMMKRMPEATRETLTALKTASQHGQSDETIVSLSLVIHSPNKLFEQKARQEFVRIATELRDYDRAEHYSLNQSFNAYGDDDKLANYTRAGGKLDHRMGEQGYTMFRIRDENGALVALASGNANKLASDQHKFLARAIGVPYREDEFRLLNVAVAPDYRGNHYGETLLACVSHYAAEHGYKNVTMPLSINSLAKGNQDVYARANEMLDMKTPSIRPHPVSPLGVEFVMTPKLFKSIEEQQRQQQADVIAR